MKNEPFKIESEGWTVNVLIDDDNHLNIYIENEDGTNINQIETGQGDGDDGDQLATRFTTDKIR